MTSLAYRSEENCDRNNLETHQFQQNIATL